MGMMPGLSGAGNLNLVAGYMVCSVCETAVIQYTCGMCTFLVCVNTKKLQKFACTLRLRVSWNLCNSFAICFFFFLTAPIA